MNENLQLFNHVQFGQLRLIEIDGKAEIVATDLAKVLSHQSAKDMLRSLDDDEKGRRLIPTPGGDQVLSTVTEAGFYHAVLLRQSGRVKDEDIRETIKGVQRWVTHEVLPSIHKNGGYIAGQEQMDDTELMARALQVSQKVIESKQALIDQLKPKALFADAVEASSTCILIGDLAKLLCQNGVDIGQKRLFEWMRANGYLMKVGSSKNMPTQRAMDMGLFQVKERTFQNPDGSVRVTKTTKVTGRGQRYFINVFLGGEVA